jgi:hypothetical protein
VDPSLNLCFLKFGPRLYANITHAGPTATSATVTYTADDIAVLQVNGVSIGRVGNWQMIVSQFSDAVQ